MSARRLRALASTRSTTSRSRRSRGVPPTGSFRRPAATPRPGRSRAPRPVAQRSWRSRGHPRMPPLRHLLLVLAASVAVMASAGGEAAADPVIAAAGDISCDEENPEEGTGEFCRQKETSDLLVGAGLSAVLPLGDLQYRSSGACCSLFEKIMAYYDPTWGRVKSISRPVIGNHEGTWAGYFDYFNGKGAVDGPAGPRGKGYYSFDVGSWHLIALNSNCSKVPGGCSAGSAQESWLRADLAAHPTHCTL